MPKDPVITLIRTLVDTMADGLGKVPENWISLTMILESYEGAFNSFHGYAYLEDTSAIPVAADPLKVMPVLDEYLQSYYKPGETLPIAMLIQFDKTSGAYKVTMEDTDESRWKVTPKNYKEIRKELRFNS